ncbi:MAG TPA: hypothetical protein DCM62_07250 [Bacteroidales bacterium]|nr:hypothetical protein [Bacteroidales bacterium]
MGKKFKVYKSSAGSGKTYTLVKEYLKIVLIHPQRVRNILAITFTNAAAAEMKSRIIGELEGITTLSGSAPSEKSRILLNKILDELNKESSQEFAEELLVKNAAIVLTEILHNYSDFAISTIDSFVHRVVRAFAYDMGARSNFETELEANNLLKKAIDTMLSNLKKGDKTTDALSRYLVYQYDMGSSLNIEKTLQNLGSTLFDEQTRPHLDKLGEFSVSNILTLQDQIHKRLSEIERMAQTKASEALRLIHDSGLSQDVFYKKSTGIYGYFKNLSEGRIAEKLLPSKTVISTINEGKWYAASTAPLVKAAVDGIAYHLSDSYFVIAGRNQEVLQEYGMLVLARKFLLPVGLLGNIKQTLEELKNQKNVLFLSDFNQMIADSIRGEPVPYIYERLGERYSNFMIDEFQDTSVLQWHNLLPLIINGLATNNITLLVGDAKQAIYRWRNGDVAQFANLPALSFNEENSAVYRPYQDALERNYSGDPLETNFRTRKVIVEFNNGLFVSCAQLLQDPFKAIYLAAEQKHKPDSHGGYVEVAFLEKSNFEEKTFEEQMVWKVLATINRLVAAGHSYGDIAILCRSNNKGSFLARHLLDANIPVVSKESLLLGQSSEVIFFMALLRLLVNRYDTIAALDALYFVNAYCGIPEESSIHHKFVWAKEQAKDDNRATHDWLRAFDAYMESIGHTFRLENLRAMHLNAICQFVSEAFFVQNPPSTFVLFFQDVVFNFYQKHTPSVREFLYWWDEFGQKESIALPQGINAVQIATIHKSKGLEFPVVILPFFSLSGSTTERKQLWVAPNLPSIPDMPPVLVGISKKNLEETPFESEYVNEKNSSMLDRVNLAYVACTRAKDKLFVFAEEVSQNQSESNFNKVLYEYVKNTGMAYHEGNSFSYGTFENAAGLQSKEGYKHGMFEISKMYAGVPQLITTQPGVLTNREGALNKAQKRGMLLHKVLEKIATIDDVLPIVDSLIANAELQETDAREFKDNLHALLNDPLLAPCFSPKAKIKRESELFDSKGNMVRPDRVVFFPDRTVVIDYKTGEPAESHRLQMAIYSGLLAQMGYTQVQSMLVYIDSGQIIAL